jgi:hypothetical protein
MLRLLLSRDMRAMWTSPHEQGMQSELKPDVGKGSKVAQVHLQYIRNGSGLRICRAGRSREPRCGGLSYIGPAPGSRASHACVFRPMNATFRYIRPVSQVRRRSGDKVPHVGILHSLVGQR